MYDNSFSCHNYTNDKKSTSRRWSKRRRNGLYTYSSVFDDLLDIIRSRLVLLCCSLFNHRHFNGCPIQNKLLLLFFIINRPISPPTKSIWMDEKRRFALYLLSPSPCVACACARFFSSHFNSPCLFYSLKKFFRNFVSSFRRVTTKACKWHKRDSIYTIDGKLNVSKRSALAESFLVSQMIRKSQ